MHTRVISASKRVTQQDLVLKASSPNCHYTCKFYDFDHKRFQVHCACGGSHCVAFACPPKFRRPTWNEYDEDDIENEHNETSMIKRQLRGDVAADTKDNATVIANDIETTSHPSHASRRSTPIDADADVVNAHSESDTANNVRSTRPSLPVNLNGNDRYVVNAATSYPVLAAAVEKFEVPEWAVVVEKCSCVCQRDSRGHVTTCRCSASNADKEKNRCDMRPFDCEPGSYLEGR